MVTVESTHILVERMSHQRPFPIPYHFAQVLREDLRSHAGYSIPGWQQALLWCLFS